MAKKTKKIVKDEVSETIEESHEEVQENLDKKENTKEESLIENKIVHKPTLNYGSRGFKSEQEARDFINTPYFKNLGEADKEEFMAWLNK